MFIHLWLLWVTGSLRSVSLRTIHGEFDIYIVHRTFDSNTWILFVRVFAQLPRVGTACYNNNERKILFYLFEHLRNLVFAGLSMVVIFLASGSFVIL